jgi:hypothetical protein
VPHLPRSVRQASLLLALAATLSILDALTCFLALRHLNAASPAFVRTVGSSGVDLVAEVRSRLGSNVVVALVAAMVLAWLGLAIRRPSPAARIAAWCAAVMTVVALACGIALGPEEPASPSGRETPETRVALENLVAGWYTVVHGVIVAVLLAAMITLALLLTRTSARDFYGRRPPD